jgi:endonuclease/exonuclease/phosphatase family metal-dependent hydrolase
VTGPGRAPARLRAVTWNVRTCLRREDERVDLGLTVATLRSLDADLVALQELDRDQERSDRADQARALGEALGMRWYYAPALLGLSHRPDTWRQPGPDGDPGGPAYGVALLSRLAVEAVTTDPLPRPRGRGEPRVALLARVRAGERPLSVAVTHLSPAPGDAVPQLRWLQRRLAAEPPPRLLLGDLNLWLPIVRLVSLPGWRPLVRGGTFRNRAPDRPLPTVQIDHVLAHAGDDLRVRRAWIAAGPVSDHRAAVVDLEVSQAEGRSNQAW